MHKRYTGMNVWNIWYSIPFNAITPTFKLKIRFRIQFIMFPKRSLGTYCVYSVSSYYVPQTKFGNILFLLCFFLLLRSSVPDGRPYSDCTVY